MTTYCLDDVDEKLLTLLQEDARYTALALAEEVGVSDNTIHNRMGRLEDAGVITGYRAAIDYDRVGLNLYFQFPVRPTSTSAATSRNARWRYRRCWR